MKDILIKLSNGQNNFDCEFNGQKRKCEILLLDLVLEKAFVRFDKPVKKIVRKEIENQWGLDYDDSPDMEDVEIDSIEEWISLS